MSPGPFTLTSFDPSSGFAPPPASPRNHPPPELIRRLSESFGGWPQAWSIWQDVPMTPWGYPMSGAPFARGASGTTNDRMGGRDLPLFWNEVDLRGFRVLSRFLCDTNGFAIGFLDRLTDYHVRKGFAWQACRKGQKKTPYPTTTAGKDPLIVKAQAILDQWKTANKWPARSREAFRRWRRDGEVFFRLFLAGRGRLPVGRFVEPEQVGSPDGATTGPYSFGIETDPHDAMTRWAYHLWDMDSGQTRGEWVDAERIIHLAANVDSTIKRGLPDFFPVQDQLDGVRRLLRNIIETAITQAAVPWMEKFPTATAGQVRALLPQVADERQQNGVAGYPFGSGPYGQQWGGGNLPPGSIPRMEGNREIIPGPTSAGISGYIEAEQACLRGCGARWGMPEYFSGDASNNSFNSAIVGGSQYALAIEGGQILYGTFEQEVALKVFDLCVPAGLLTQAERDQLDVETTEPAVVTPEPEKETTRREQLNRAGVLSRTTWQLQEQLDPQHEAENMKAEAPVQVQQPGIDPNAQPGDPNTQPQPGGEKTIGQLMGETRIITSWLAEHGFTGTDKRGVKWVDGKPQKRADDPGTGRDPAATQPPAEFADPKGILEAITQGHQHPDDAGTPGLLNHVKEKVNRVREAVYGMMIRATPSIMAIVPELIDTPEDFRKFGFAPTVSGTASASADPIKAATGISTHLACSIASRVLAAGYVWAKAKLAGAPMGPQAEGVNGGAEETAAAWLAETLEAIAKAIGFEATIDREAILSAIHQRQGANS